MITPNARGVPKTCNCMQNIANNPPVNSTVGEESLRDKLKDYFTDFRADNLFRLDGKLRVTSVDDDTIYDLERLIKSEQLSMLERLEKKSKHYTPVTIHKYGNTHHTNKIIQAIRLSAIQQEKEKLNG